VQISDTNLVPVKVTNIVTDEEVNLMIEQRYVFTENEAFFKESLVKKLTQ
jgi:hypothetical protein